MLQMAEFWVGIAFLVFVAILLYYKVPGLITKALDERAQVIRKELDEARRLREEAQNLLADYQKKHRSVAQEAEAIVDLARREAEALAQETRTSLREALERRTKAAEEKIARAEAQAVDEVRASAIEVAVTAAEKILRQKMQGSEGAALLDQSIRDLKGRLN
jgi:F-type H+-transporting ATPase subunit b